MRTPFYNWDHEKIKFHLSGEQSLKIFCEDRPYSWETARKNIQVNKKARAEYAKLAKDWETLLSYAAMADNFDIRQLTDARIAHLMLWIAKHEQDCLNNREECPGLYQTYKDVSMTITNEKNFLRGWLATNDKTEMLNEIDMLRETVDELKRFVPDTEIETVNRIIDRVEKKHVRDGNRSQA